MAAYPGETLAAQPVIMGSTCVPLTPWALVRYSAGPERRWELAQRFRSTLGIRLTSCSRFLGGTEPEAVLKREGGNPALLMGLGGLMNNYVFASSILNVP